MIACRRAASTSRVYGKRILALNSLETCLWKPNAISPHSLLNMRETPFIPSSLKAQNDDGFHGFGSNFRGFSGFSNKPASEDDDGGDDDSCSERESDDEERSGGGYVSPNNPPMYRIVFNPQDPDISASLDKWLKDGNVLIEEEYETVIKGLLNRRLFRVALQVSSWALNKKSPEITDTFHAIHLECICLTENFSAAWQYFERIPSDKRGVKVYKVLLKSCLFKNDVRRAEFCFKKLKGLSSELGIVEYNTMLHVYCLYDRRKIPKFLESMLASNIKPNVDTYRNLIRGKQLVNDVNGMIEVVEKMRAEGLEPNSAILSILAKQCIKSSMVEKAEKTLHELEKIYDQNRDRSRIRSQIVRNLLLNYASLKKQRDVERHWKEIESDANTPLRDLLMGVLAWGRLGKVDKADKIIDSLLESGHKLKVPDYNLLIQVYAEHGLQSKAEKLLEQMSKEGIKMNRHVRATLARLYVHAGDLERAESMLSDDCGEKPTFHAFMTILKAYAGKGDTINAEKIYKRMKEAGYKNRYVAYVQLLQAYIKANVPAYGFKHRLYEDKFVPDKRLQNLIEEAKGS